MQQRTFRAMGTDIELFVAATDADDLLREAEAEFHRLESVLSRFGEDSELATLNRDGAIDASPDLLQVTRLALAARELTAGRFDPTVHDAVVAAGYDRTFELVPGDVPWRRAVACGGRVRIFGSGIQLARGVRLDFGGIGKGYAAERAATILAPAGPCLVNAGGDVAVRDGVWPVGVEMAAGSVTLELSGGALATSGRDRRRWRCNGEERHHLIDPSTGASAGGDLLRATVMGRDAVDAEVWAKALFLAGATAAAAEADARRIPCVLVTTTGETTMAGGLR